MLNPTLLVAVTVMLLIPNPKRLMVGYLLGAYTTSITLGRLIVFSLRGSTTASTSEHTVSYRPDKRPGNWCGRRLAHYPRRNHAAMSDQATHGPVKRSGE